MIKKIKIALLTIASMAAVSTPMLATAAVHAQSNESPEVTSGLCAGAQLNAGATTCDPTNDQAATDKINSIIKLVINILSLIVGVVAVIMIIVGGLKYITSGGDSGNISSAKNTILYAIIGLVVVALSQFVVRFVLTKLTTPSA